MFSAYGAFWKKSFDFNGSTSRIDFWLVALVNFLIIIVLALFGYLLAAIAGEGAAIGPVALIVLYSIAAIIPSLSIQIRRLRDAGLSPFLILLNFIPYIGAIAGLVLYLQPAKDRSAG